MFVFIFIYFFLRFYFHLRTLNILSTHMTVPNNLGFVLMFIYLFESSSPPFILFMCTYLFIFPHSYFFGSLRLSFFWLPMLFILYLHFSLFSKKRGKEVCVYVVESVKKEKQKNLINVLNKNLFKRLIL